MKKEEFNRLPSVIRAVAQMSCWLDRINGNYKICNLNHAVIQDIPINHLVGQIYHHKVGRLWADKQETKLTLIRGNKPSDIYLDSYIAIERNKHTVYYRAYHHNQVFTSDTINLEHLQNIIPENFNLICNQMVKLNFALAALVNLSYLDYTTKSYSEPEVQFLLANWDMPPQNVISAMEIDVKLKSMLGKICVQHTSILPLQLNADLANCIAVTQ